ncbi:MAG: hypothetical protein WCR21_12470 [Bacteroidota bacterium]
MNLGRDFFNAITKKRAYTLVESIGDLKDKLSAGSKLTYEEKTAINNYERYKANVLNAELDEEKFQNKYKQMQVIANLGDWREFLKEEYF